MEENDFSVCLTCAMMLNEREEYDTRAEDLLATVVRT